MNKAVLFLSFFSFSSLAYQSSDETKFSFGLGVGSIYSGLGANVAMMSENDMKYVSYGCVSHGSSSGTGCGAGLGWITTELFDFGNNKHGFGAYISIVDREGVIKLDNQNRVESKYQDVYGAGISYNYFMNGINQSGFVFGASVHATNADYNDSYGAFFQAGYQF